MTHNKTENVSDATLYTFHHWVESIQAESCIQTCPKLSNPLFVLFNFNHFELSTHIYNQTLCIKVQQRIFSRKLQPELFSLFPRIKWSWFYVHAKICLFLWFFFLKFSCLIAFDAVARKRSTNTSAWYYNSKRAGAFHLGKF